MRLTKQQHAGIIRAIETFTTGQTTELMLYGSRIHDDLKGGDIDLLLIIQDATFKKSLLLQKHRILSAIKREIGDQRIDLTIATRKDTQTDPFLQTILPDALSL